MLGKTNITALSEGAIVTEIEDYKWIQMQSGVYDSIAKAIYKNGYLAAITENGAVVYTTDGDAWSVSSPEYADCKLNDIDFDGSSFVLAGSRTKTVSISGEEQDKQIGMILSTTDFVSYEEQPIWEDSSYGVDKNNYVSEYLSVYPANGKYYGLCRWKKSGIEEETRLCSWEESGQVSSLKSFGGFQGLCTSAKNSEGYIFAVPTKYGSAATTTYPVEVYSFNCISEVLHTIAGKMENNDIIPVFECKDELYYMRQKNDSLGYKFAKLLQLSSGQEVLLSTDVNYGFISGVYFNECSIFINRHSMLILKKRESIADKTLDDLIDIAPELSLNCITKAFGQLYAFGNRGVILKSSAEADNEEAVIVQTISAKKALLDAKKYADERYAELEIRIAALEGVEESNEE